MKKSSLILALSLFFAALVSGCDMRGGAASPGSVPWAVADLRAFDPPEANDPSGDLIAAYARTLTDQVQVRLDLLDSDILADHDLFIAIDNAPGGLDALPDGTDTDISWDKLIYLPAHGQIRMLDNQFRPVPLGNILAMRNPGLDTVELSMLTKDLQGYPGRLNFQVFSTQAGSGSLADSMAPFALADHPPSPASTLLAFWNTLPAYSSAQALRRWDGAHTGPLGARHGLGNLLKAARDYQAPVALLDLKSISSLAALDFLGQVDSVRRLAEQELLILPDALPLLQTGPASELSDTVLESAATSSRQVATDFGLPATQFVYGALSRASADRYRFLFLPTSTLDGFGVLGATSNIYRYTGLAVLPISTGMTTTQATLQGPSLEIRRELVNEALRASGGESDAVTILGGDLTRSTWGDPQQAAATLQWLSAHPWINLLDAEDLLSTHPTQEWPEGIISGLAPQNAQELPDNLETSVEWAAQTPEFLAANAWQAFLALYAPVSPGAPQLPALRRAYLGQVNTLIKAARWAQDPQPIASCEVDLDLDNNPECILASQSQFAAFEIDSGALVYAFVLLGGEAHQWIAPSSQFITGLSDPALWRLDLGLTADPAVIPGAFSDAGPFRADIQPREVTFTGPDLTKTFTLLDNGIEVRYQSNRPQAARIPLAIDPWLRFKPDWAGRYAGDKDSTGLTWGIPGAFQVVVRSNAGATLQEFTAARASARGPENPNFDYPAGHFVTFPLAVVDITAPAGFVVSLQFLP